MGNIDFPQWFAEQLSLRHWNKAEFMRRSGVSDAHISRIASGYFQPGQEFLNKCAKAFNLPREIVYRAAGILPPEKGKSDNLYVQELCEIVPRLVRESDLRELVYLANLKLEEQEKEKEKAKKQV